MHGQASSLTPERRAWLATFRSDTSKIDALTRDGTLRPPQSPRVPGEREASTLQDVTRGLGLGVEAELALQERAAEWLQAPNDLRVRGRMLPALQRLCPDAAMRATVYRRVLACYRAQGGAPGLEKGAGHKYLKRVPTGKQRPKWRYIYKITRKRGEGLIDDDALQAGTKLRVAHRGEEGHFEVLSHDTAKQRVHVRHDESGRDAHIDLRDLKRMVAAYHEKRGTPVPEPRKPRKRKDADLAQPPEAAPEQPAPEPPKPAPTPPTPGGVGTASLGDLQTGTYDRVDGFHAGRAEAEARAREVADSGREAALVPQPGGFVIVSRATRQAAPAAPERRYDGAQADLYLRGKGGPEKVTAKWVLVEADDLVASHDAIRFHPREDYPTDVQERRYHEIDAEQHKVDRIARKLEPAIVANTNPDAINGAPIVVSTPTGLAVLGGNGRTMAAQRAFELYPESADALRAHLAHVAPQFGLSAAAVKGMRKPMLVRQMDAADTSTQSLRLLGRRMNEGLTQGLDPRSEEVAIGKTLVSHDVLQTLAAGIGDDQTLPDYLTGTESRPFVAALHRAGVIDEINAAQYVDQETGLLNEQGRLRAERVLAARFLPDASVLDRMNPSLRANLALATASLVSAEQEGWDLRAPLMAAVKADLDMRTRGFKTGQKEIDRYMAQRELGEVGGPAAAVQQDPLAARLLTVVREHNKGRVLPRAMRGVALRAKSAKHQAGSLPGIFDSAPETLSGALDAEFGLRAPEQQQASLFAARREGLDLRKATRRTPPPSKAKARAMLYARAQALASVIVQERMGAATGAGLRPQLDGAAIAAEVRRDLERVVRTDRALRGAPIPSATAVGAMVEAMIAVGQTSLRKARAVRKLVAAPPGAGWEPPTAKRRAWRKMGPHGHIYWYGSRGGGETVEERTELDVDDSGSSVRRVERSAPRPATAAWASGQADMVADLGEVRRATELVGRVQRAIGDAAPPALRSALEWEASIEGVRRKIRASRDVMVVHALQEQARQIAREAADVARAWELKQRSIFGTPEDVPHLEMTGQQVADHAKHVAGLVRAGEHETASRYLSAMQRHHSATDVRRISGHVEALHSEQRAARRVASLPLLPAAAPETPARPRPAPTRQEQQAQLALFRSRVRLVFDLLKAAKRGKVDPRQTGLMFGEPEKPKPQPAPAATVTAPAPAAQHHGPPGQGWTLIPHSRHGGYHKRVGDHWVYWYPGDGETSRATPHADDHPAKAEPAAQAPKPAAPEERPEAKTPEGKTKVAAKDVEPGGKYETTGYIFGSRAELWELNNQGALEVDPAVAHKVVTKDKVLGGAVTPESFAAERGKGVSAEAAFAKFKLLSAVSQRPPDSAEHRAAFLEGLAVLQSSLGHCREARDVDDVMQEWGTQAQGHKLIVTMTPAEAERKGLGALLVPRPKSEDLFPRSRFGSEQYGRELQTYYAREKERRATWAEARNEAQRRAEELLARDIPEGASLRAEKQADGSLALIAVTPDAPTARAAALRIEALGPTFARVAGFRVDYDYDPSTPVEKREPNRPTHDGAAHAGWIANAKYIPPGTREVRRNAPKQRTDFLDARATIRAAASDDEAWQWTGVVRKQRSGEARAVTREEGPDYHSILAQLKMGPVTRRGPAVAGNDGITAEGVRDSCGLNVVEYGNWASEDERQWHTEAAHAALQDLADILGVDKQQIGQRRRLSVSIGGRGNGHARAHYEPGGKVINITKKSGKGSLAHEWGHFLDHMLLSVYRPQSGKDTSLVDMVWSGGQDAAKEVPETVRAAMHEVARAIRYGEHASVSDASALAQFRSRHLDAVRDALTTASTPQERSKLIKTYNQHVSDYNNARRPPTTAARQRAREKVRAALGHQSDFYAESLKAPAYWHRPHEMFARAFEAYVTDRGAAMGRENTYLVDGARASRETRLAMFYPSERDRKTIHAAFDKLIQAVKDSDHLSKALRAMRVR